MSWTDRYSDPVVRRMAEDDIEKNRNLDQLKKLTAERDALRAENENMVATAAEAIGTCDELKNAACVAVLADAYKRGRAELTAAQKRIAELEKTLKLDFNW